MFSLIHTKTKKPREVISFEPKRKDNGQRFGSYSCLERIRDRFEELEGLALKKCFKSIDYIFRLPSTNKVVRQEALSKNFKKWMIKAKLLTDRFGTKRTL